GVEVAGEARPRAGRLRGPNALPRAALPARQAGVTAGQARTERRRVKETAVVEQRRRLAQRVVLPVRMAVEVLWGEQLAQVGVTLEDDAHHVEALALEEAGAWPDAGAGGNGLALVQVDAQEQPLGAREVVDVVNDGEALSLMARVRQVVHAVDVGEHLVAQVPDGAQSDDDLIDGQSHA